MNLEIRKKRESEPSTYRYEILLPSGNDTAVVWTNNILDLKSNDQLRKQIDRKIKSRNPHVEQVGFLDLSNPEKPTVMMVGLEFCGNFLRCCAYLIYLQSGRKNKSIQLELILENETLVVNTGVDGLQNAWAEVPVPNDFSRVSNEKYSLVNLKGITQIVVAYSEQLASSANNMIDRARYFLATNSLEYLHRNQKRSWNHVY